MMSNEGGGSQSVDRAAALQAGFRHPLGVGAGAMAILAKLLKRETGIFEEKPHRKLGGNDAR